MTVVLSIILGLFIADAFAIHVIFELDCGDAYDFFTKDFKDYPLIATIFVALTALPYWLIIGLLYYINNGIFSKSINDIKKEKEEKEKKDYDDYL